MEWNNTTVCLQIGQLIAPSQDPYRQYAIMQEPSGTRKYWQWSFKVYIYWSSFNYFIALPFFKHCFITLFIKYSLEKIYFIQPNPQVN